MEYRPRIQSAWGIPTSAERLAVAAAMGVVHRELTPDEHRIAVALAGDTSEEVRRLDRQVDDYRHRLWLSEDRCADLAAQLADCERRCLDLRRMIG